MVQKLWIYLLWLLRYDFFKILNFDLSHVSSTCYVLSTCQVSSSCEVCKYVFFVDNQSGEEEEEEGEEQKPNNNNRFSGCTRTPNYLNPR